LVAKIWKKSEEGRLKYFEDGVKPKINIIIIIIIIILYFQWSVIGYEVDFWGGGWGNGKPKLRLRR
jgi:hypothetical protein